jgi:hypothetical protein
MLNEAGTDEAKGVEIYSSGSNKTNFVFRNQYFGPLKGGFRGENRDLPRVRKNDRFVEPMCYRDSVSFGALPVRMNISSSLFHLLFMKPCLICLRS